MRNVSVNVISAFCGNDLTGLFQAPIRVSSIQQGFRQMRADKAGSPGEQSSRSVNPSCSEPTCRKELLDTINEPVPQILPERWVTPETRRPFRRRKALDPSSCDLTQRFSQKRNCRAELQERVAGDIVTCSKVNLRLEENGARVYSFVNEVNRDPAVRTIALN